MEDAVFEKPADWVSIINKNAREQTSKLPVCSETKRKGGSLQKPSFVLEFKTCWALVFSHYVSLSSLVYTKTVDSVDGARWLARQTPDILCYLPPSNSRENGVRFECVTSEEIIQLIVCGVYYLTFLVYTKVAVYIVYTKVAVDIYLAASRLGKYPLLATSTSVNSC